MKLIVRSKNTSCKDLRKIETPFRVIYRMGSSTPTSEILPRRKPNSRKPLLEINSPESCILSNDKIKMKRRFTHAKLPTAEWFTVKDSISGRQKVAYWLTKWRNIIVKHKHSSKGNGIYLIRNIRDYDNFVQRIERPIVEYVFERYYTYSREYRLHVTREGCFFANRKMLKEDAEVRWHRHDNNSVWILESNELFNKPNNWDEIVESCVNALKSLGLHIAAFDIKVQKSDVENPKWIILESNSAPSLGDVTREKYKEKLTEIINKFNVI